MALQLCVLLSLPALSKIVGPLCWQKNFPKSYYLRGSAKQVSYLDALTLVSGVLGVIVKVWFFSRVMYLAVTNDQRRGIPKRSATTKWNRYHQGFAGTLSFISKWIDKVSVSMLGCLSGNADFF